MSTLLDAPRHRGARDAAGATGAGGATYEIRVEPARRSWTRRGLSWLVTLAMVLCALLFAFVALGPHLFGYRTAVMLTGSMEPGISPGDVVVTVPRPAEDVAVGDVLSYHIPVEDHRVETHRITKVIHRKDGSTAIVTKGDANSDDDPWTATLIGDTVWQEVLVVPHLGSVVRAMRTPVVQNGVFWGALGGVVLVGLSAIWAREKDIERSEETDELGEEGSA